ncbi:MAG: beta-galactosidase [Verrucomicrobia bacterium]|nr:beta-galactosidase [Verrucomicrobiota bacterium]
MAAKIPVGWFLSNPVEPIRRLKPINTRHRLMYGYYLFLGRGDYHLAFGPEVIDHPPQTWTSTWDASDWRRRIDFLVDRLDADTLAILMNGFLLPYPSQRFPEVREKDHPNVQCEFLQEILDHARGRGLSLIATFCTTGHAMGYAKAHPECAVVAATGLKQRFVDADGRHAFNLCHHHLVARAYAIGVVEEVLTRYRGFSGVLFHPPEHFVSCRCRVCEQAFHVASKKSFAEASDRGIDAFYWATCMAFQGELVQRARTLLPSARMLTFDVPGPFDEHFDVIAPQISPMTAIVHWDYSSYRPEQYASLKECLRFFQTAGHRLIFTPTSSYNLATEDPEYGDKVVKQIDMVLNAGIQDVLYYHGPIWMEDTILATSWKPARVFSLSWMGCAEASAQRGR